MTRTPDEIKKGLEHCINGTSCRGCPYCEECAIASDCNPMHKDLQEYVQQLEEFADKKIVELFEKVEQLQAERDAAADALTKIVQNHDESFCEYCDNWDRYLCPPFCRTYCERFKWRGVQKEDGNA